MQKVYKVVSDKHFKLNLKESLTVPCYRCIRLGGTWKFNSFSIGPRTQICKFKSNLAFLCDLYLYTVFLHMCKLCTNLSTIMNFSTTPTPLLFDAKIRNGLTPLPR